jgi:hypothetical protein
MSEDHRDDAPATAPMPNTDEIVDVTNDAVEAGASTPDLPVMQEAADEDAPQEDEAEQITNTARLPPVAAAPPPTPSAPPLPAAAMSPQPAPPVQYVQVVQVQPGAMPYAGSPFQAPRVPRPVVGPAMSVFGALLWTFVVAGQFTTSWMSGAPLGEGAAIAMVFFGTLVAWFLAVRRSQIVPVSGRGALFGRALAIGAMAFGLFVAVVLGATFLGAVSSQNHDLVIALALLALSAVASFMGPRVTAPVRAARTHSAQLASVALWIGAAIVSAIACAELAANG